jgi:hypothetical protein
MPGRIFFRNDCATVTSTEVVVGGRTYPLDEIISARSVRRRSLLPPLTTKFALILTTKGGEWELLRHRNGYVVFQLAQAIELALRELGKPMARSA